MNLMPTCRRASSGVRYGFLPGLSVEALLAQSQVSKFDLTLFLTDEGDDIFLEIEYSTDLFDEARIELMVGHLRTLLEAQVERTPDGGD